MQSVDLQRPRGDLEFGKSLLLRKRHHRNAADQTFGCPGLLLQIFEEHLLTGVGEVRRQTDESRLGLAIEDAPDEADNGPSGETVGGRRNAAGSLNTRADGLFKG